MGETTGIAWTDKTWNPWHGCHKISAGCKFCYMFRDKARYGQEPNVVLRSKTTFYAPLSWPSSPARCFTCSWSDWFIEEADAWRDEAYAVIRATPWITYQILTKRIERTAGRFPSDLGNVWLGVSVENREAKHRIDALREIPAALRFLSIEPQLEDVGVLDLRGISWVIIGGESGTQARPFDIGWLRNIAAQCKAADVKYFVKQMGYVCLQRLYDPAIDRNAFGSDHEWPLGTHFGNRTGMVALNGRQVLLKDRAGADPAEWPEDARVQEFPVAVAWAESGENRK